MKARVKATGEIIEVSQGIYSPYQYVDDNGTIYTEEHLEILQKDGGVIFIDPTIDYWTRLEHQAAIGAMQGMLSNATIVTALVEGKSTLIHTIPRQAKLFAHALVEKYKENEKAMH